ncbi:MAG: hypothetical protein RIC15_00580 [Vicingaceae bacterium]
MTDQTEQNEPIIIPARNRTNRLLVISNIILLALCIFLLWDNNQSKNTISRQDSDITQLSDERSRLESELEEMLSEYQTLETDNEDLRAEMEMERAKVEELLAKVKNGNWEIHKLKKEAASLREIMKGYIVTIDSLNTLNQTLIAENQVVRSDLKKVQGKNEELQKVNTNLEDQVTKAQRLKAMNISSYGVKIKGDNTGRETDRAKKSEKIRTCFTLAENQVAIAGNKELFLRILTPDGRILSEGTGDNYRFTFNGVRGLYSTKKQVNYQNKEAEVCMDWIVKEELPIGEYIVEIFCDEADIGRTKMRLR